MTTISTLLAFGSMPLNMWLYCRSWSAEDGATIPYVNICITLISILAPIALGQLIKWRSVKVAKIITKVMPNFSLLECKYTGNYF